MVHTYFKNLKCKKKLFIMITIYTQQAVLKLMSSLEMDYENYQHITGLTGKYKLLVICISD